MASIALLSSPPKTPLLAEVKRTFGFDSVSPQKARLNGITWIATVALSLIAGAIGRIGLYVVSTELTPDNPALGNTLACCFVAAWGSLAFLSYLKLIQSASILTRLADPAKPHSRLAETAKVAASVAGGFFAEFPFIYFAGQSNKNFLFTIPAATNVILPAVSIYLTLNNIRSIAEWFGPKTEKAKFIENIEKTLVALPTMAPADREELVACCRSLRDPSTDREIGLNQFFQKIRTVKKLDDDEPPCATKWATLSFATLLSGAQLFWIGYLGYDGWNSLTSSEALSITFTVLAILFNAYYMQELAYDFCTTLPPLFTAHRKRTLAETHSPLALPLKALFCLVASGAAGGAIVLSQKLPAPWNILSSILFGAQTIGSPIPPMTRAIDATVSYFGASSEDPSRAAHFDLQNRLRQLCVVLSNSSSEEVSKLISPPDTELTAPAISLI